jgi:O-antigen ligase
MERRTGVTGVLSKSIAYMTGGVLAASIVLGGSRSGLLGDLILEVISVFLLCAALSQLITSHAVRHLKWPLIFAALVALLPLAQLIPLPSALWTRLPGREVISETYRLLNQSQPLLPLTMSPSATWLNALLLIPPMAIFLGCLTLDFAQRRAISVVVIVMGVISVFLGFLQLAQGPNSALRFYEITNRDDAVGFFANRNHFAALLYATMLFAAVWLADATIKVGLEPRRRATQSASVLLFVACLMAFVLLVVAQMMARSRAGLGLSIVALFASLALGLTDRRAVSSRAKSAKIAFGATALVIIFSLQFALYRILERFASDPLADARIPFARNTLTAAKAYMPFGSGLGTFVPVYQMFEKPTDVFGAYANHAHNDLLEVWLETGVFGLLLIGLFLLWVARRTFLLWRGQISAQAGDVDLGLARAASLVIALLLLHSLVDYPLRTGAMIAVFAFSCALLIPPQTSGEALAADATAARRSRREESDVLTPRDSHRRRGGSANPMTPDLPSSPPPREPWGQSVEWPEAWRGPKTSSKDGSDKKKR